MPTPRATLTILSCSSNFPSASHLDESTLTYEPIVNYEMNKLLPAQWRVISDDIRERWHSASFTSLKNKLALNLYWPKEKMFGIKPCVCSLYSSLFYFAVQNKPISFYILRFSHRSRQSPKEVNTPKEYSPTANVQTKFIRIYVKWCLIWLKKQGKWSQWIKLAKKRTTILW